MKQLLAILIWASMALTAEAFDDQISSSNVNPFISTSRSVDKCLDGNGNSCMASYSTSSSFTTFASTFGQYKEEIRQVEPDAYHFLAGEEKTLALDHVLQLVRADSAELAELSDMELTTLLIEGVE